MSEKVEEQEIQIETKTFCYISNITFNNGDSLEVAKNDIIIFVGPNNVGKSQSLRDIYSLAESDKPTTVIDGIEIVKNNTESTLKSR